MLSKTEMLKEENSLNERLDIIKEKMDNLNINLEDVSDDLNEFREYVWGDCQGLMSSEDIDKRMEFNHLLSEQMKKEIRQKDLKVVKKHLIKSYNSPFFGKIVFNDDDIYIGSSGIEKDGKIKIYDWRAPISSLYYDYELGDASYKVNDNNIRGTISQKRQFIIDKSKIKSVIENDKNIVDELLQDILAKESSEKMSNIINTIQTEQNKVIRNVTDNILITEGVAGSGKTQIALHRIAYLLYHKQELTSNNVLILSPNKIFSEYISNVLPSLNEENVLCTTFSNFARRYINKETESYSNFLDRVYNSNVEIKQFDDNYKDLIDEFVKRYVDSIEITKEIGMNTNIYKRELLTDLYRRYDKFNVMERLERMSEYMLGFAHIKLKNEYIISVKEKILSVLSKSIDAIDIYNEFLRENNMEEIGDIIYYEHITPILYITFLINDYPKDIHVKHIVIDEAQDYSKFQLFLLKKIFVSSAFTILGDANQNLNPYINYSSLEEFKDIFNESLYIKLSKAYRSVKNIMDYATHILGISIDCFRPNGNEVITRESNNLKEDIINDIKTFDNKRSAIITNTKEDAEYIYNLIKDDIEVSSPLFDNMKTKLQILPVYIAKGLEFDSVIIYNANVFKKNLLYVAATRAQNNLIVYK